ncbi:hypothetical protein B0H14DRAFT_3442703 [Mycena olivaceomarginata]|nr:hypothetical protein B0H14DRAFT_3442703 [Mycena olivaceomarginata]
MATVHPQQPLPHHRDVLKKVPLNAPRQSAYSVPPPQPQPTATDPFYGYEYIAQLSARFITHLFACPPFPPPIHPLAGETPRLKAHFPTARGSSGHRLFISAFMIASKVICDDTYSNKSWSIVAQGMFTLREINQMEREMCNYLDWELNVDDPILANFEAMVQRDFPPNSKGPYPMYSLHMVSKRAAKAAVSTSATPIPEPDSATSSIPAFGQQRQATPTQAYPPPPPPILAPPLYKKSTPPMTPDTPSHIHSNKTLPTSSISPPTPTGPVDHNAKIHEGKSHFEISPGLAIAAEVPPIHPLKGKMFAFAIPAIW